MKHARTAPSSSARRRSCPVFGDWPVSSWIVFAAVAARFASASITQRNSTSFRRQRFLTWFMPIPPGPIMAMGMRSVSGAERTMAGAASAAAVAEADWRKRRRGWCVAVMERYRD